MPRKTARPTPDPGADRARHQRGIRGLHDPDDTDLRRVRAEQSDDVQTVVSPVGVLTTEVEVHEGQDGQPLGVAEPCIQI